MAGPASVGFLSPSTMRLPFAKNVAGATRKPVLAKSSPATQRRHKEKPLKYLQPVYNTNYFKPFTMIPVCDLQQQYLHLKEEIDAAMQEVATSGHFILGPQVKAFEQEMADYCGCQYAIGVGSGTDALHLSLLALGIGPGDEVITTPFTFIATTEAIGMVGAKPVFVDIDPRTFNIDVSQIEAAITPHTKAILPVHLYGQPCEMDTIMDLAREHSLHVVEDAAQALGASYQGQKIGTLGTAGCFSFFPSKNLGCFGDGGMVVTNDAEVYSRVEMLRRHGGKVKYHHSELGLNSRLDALQAAILRIKLRHLDSWNRSRRENAYRYNQLLTDVPGVQSPREISSQGVTTPSAIREQNDRIEPVYHQYTVLVQDRDTVQAQLSSDDIGTAVYYPVPLHLQEVHQDLGLVRGAFPHAEHVSGQCVSLTMFPELQMAQQEFVARKISESLCSHFIDSKKKLAG